MSWSLLYSYAEKEGHIHRRAQTTSCRKNETQRPLLAQGQSRAKHRRGRRHHAAPHLCTACQQCCCTA